jgi:uncharacterized protein YyaL (SSP411 family)
VWTKAEIDSIVGKQAADLVNTYYRITASGNWEDGKNVLFRRMSLEELAKEKGITIEECSRLLTEAEQKLLTARNKRERPTLDDKILVSWNALMMKGYIDAYYALSDPAYLQAAVTNAKFIERNFIRDNGQLWRSFSQGKPGIDAFLDDYALLARSFISLYQAPTIFCG